MRRWHCFGPGLIKEQFGALRLTPTNLSIRFHRLPAEWQLAATPTNFANFTGEETNRHLQAGPPRNPSFHYGLRFRSISRATSNRSLKRHASVAMVRKNPKATSASITARPL